MICPQCNMTLHEGEKFCPNCGTPIDVSLYEEEKQIRNQQTGYSSPQNRTQNVTQNPTQNPVQNQTQYTAGGAAPYQGNPAYTQQYTQNGYNNPNGPAYNRNMYNAQPPKKGGAPVALIVILSVVVVILLGVVIFLFASNSCKGCNGSRGATTPTATQATQAPSTAKQTDPPTLAPDTQKPTQPSTQAPTQPSTQAPTPSQEYDASEGWQVTLSGDYVDSAELVDNGNSVSFYAKSTYEDSTIYDGLLFSIINSDSSDTSVYPRAQLLGSKETGDGTVYFIAIFVTDVRYDPSDKAKADEYRTLYDQEDDILNSFKVSQ